MKPVQAMAPFIKLHSEGKKDHRCGRICGIVSNPGTDRKKTPELTPQASSDS
jgi:hypothetical protein